MGLADLALGMKIRYGSEPFIVLVEDIMSIMANAAAQASAHFAEEKGVFPRYDYDLISQSTFFEGVYSDETKELIKEKGLRNSRLLSIAPTGSISNVLGVSGGVEPFFMLGYNRNIQSVFEGEKTITVWEKTPKELAQHLGVDSIEELPEWAKTTSQNIDFEERAAVQAAIQTYVDTAISSTFNLPNEANIEDVINIYFTAWNFGLKGATVFRDNCAKVGILSGLEGWQVDKNPAKKPKVTVHEIWSNKHTNEKHEFENTIEIGVNGEKKEIKKEISLDMCPECGSVLVKQGGCTKCSNNECYYEKCSL